MNIRRLIENNFSFLLNEEYLYTYIHEKNLFYKFIFEKKDYSILISCDWRCEWLDIIIKYKTKVLLETNYDRYMDNYGVWEEKQISQQLKEIYTLPHKSLSLSQVQLAKLVELYVKCVIIFLRKTGDASVS